MLRFAEARFASEEAAFALVYPEERAVQLVVGKAYYLEGMEPEMWDAPSAKYGAPRALAARYIGCVEGNRRWHAFEVWIEGAEAGVLFMNDDDLGKMRVTAL